MTDPRVVIRRPLLTEKSTRGTELGKYTFEVASGANKLAIRDAVQRLFNVRVKKVNTITIPGRQRRRGQHYVQITGYKKAIVTLAPGQKIDLETLT
jgi:large subunit ribosomal protein L23